jgi:hypothetical protein
VSRSSTLDPNSLCDFAAAAVDTITFSVNKTILAATKTASKSRAVNPAMAF